MKLHLKAFNKLKACDNLSFIHNEKFKPIKNCRHSIYGKINFHQMLYIIAEVLYVIEHGKRM